MTRGRVLVIDDDVYICQLAAKHLQGRGYEVITALSGEQGLAIAIQNRPDVILLDVEMPDMDGIATCQEIRRHIYAPVILMGERSDETAIVLGLSVGADNFLKKPFSVPELLAFVDAAVRREFEYSHHSNNGKRMNIGDLTLDLSAHELTRNGEVISLTPTEFKLVQILAENAGKALSRDQLLDSVWEFEGDGVYSRTLDVHVGRIRKKIGDDPVKPRYIVTVKGMGYKVPKN